MMDQIEFKVAGFLRIPGDAADGNLGLMDVLEAFTGAHYPVGGHSGQVPAHCGGADGAELLLEAGVEVQFAALRQLLRCEDEHRLQTFRTDIVLRLPHQGERGVYIDAVLSMAFAAARVTLEAAWTQHVDEMFTMQTGDFFHLVE
jgi:hypothetical protein